jgi:arylsulfatase A-like enzyme
MIRRHVSAFLLLVGVLAGCTASDGTGPVNIVLISIDSLRADHVGCYGYERNTTPVLDRLAAQGAVFENVVAESSWTLPTHVTMLTGLGSLAHGVNEFVGARMSPSTVTLAERLQQAGYRTWGVYSGPYLHPVFGFGRGFDSYEGVLGPTELDVQDFDLGQTGAERTIMAESARSHRMVTSDLVSEKAAELIRAQGGREFFLFLHYFDVHYDYIPPEEIWRRFDGDYDGTLTGENFRRNSDINPDMDPRDLEHILALYDGEIYYTDRFIGKVLGALEENGLADDTLVVVTSDHGDEFFEHGNKGHAQTLFDEVLMVPLIMRLPGRIEAGLRIPEQVSHLDIASTLASFAGLGAHTSGKADEGRDLRPALTMKAVLPTRGAVSSLKRTGQLLSYRNPGMKYLVHRARSEITERLFDLSTDPEERVPLLQKSGLRPDRRQSLSLINVLPEPIIRQRFSAIVSRDLGPPAAENPEIPEELLEQLRSLGYVK